MTRPIRLAPSTVSSTAEVPYDSPAPRQLALYRCSSKGHDFSLTFAAGVNPPLAWECRCGSAAILSTATGPAAAPGGSGQRAPRREPVQSTAEHERCFRLLLQRRTRAELEELLAGRLAARRSGTVATANHDSHAGSPRAERRAR